MNIKVSVGISNRHVHLTKEVYEQLFDEELKKDYDLHQIGEFASTSFVTLKTQKGTIENVRVIGPLREYNQVEISKSDAYLLGVNPPVRTSGDLSDSEDITLVNGDKEVYLKDACVIADRHLHMNPEKAESLGLKDKDKLQVKIDGEKSGIIDVFVKVTKTGYFELHLDRDDANAFLLSNGDEVLII